MTWWSTLLHYFPVHCQTRYILSVRCQFEKQDNFALNQTLKRLVILFVFFTHLGWLKSAYSNGYMNTELIPKIIKITLKHNSFLQFCNSLVAPKKRQVLLVHNQIYFLVFFPPLESCHVSETLINLRLGGISGTGVV